MADLEYGDEDAREGWLAWAIELGRRALYVSKDTPITVHGPHAPPGDCMWGEAECCTLTPDGSFYFGYEVEFSTPRCTSIWDITGVRVWTKGDRSDRWALVPMNELPKKLQDWIREARRERGALRALAVKARR